MATRRHWAEVRKALEQDLLCENLKGRVRYFTTRYRGAHDRTGRVCILVDGQEVLNMPFQVEDEIYAEAHKRSLENGQPFREMEEEVKAEFHENGIFYPGDFGVALDEFFSNSIAYSLNSPNLLVRLLAILDRRTGKRTLERLKINMATLPDWLQFFYRLRMESESDSLGRKITCIQSI